MNNGKVYELAEKCGFFFESETLVLADPTELLAFAAEFEQMVLKKAAAVARGFVGYRGDEIAELIIAIGEEK